jgi:hypothetical protein
VASVDVTNDRLMSRLMDPDLLGGRDHPTITFKSTRVEAGLLRGVGGGTVAMGPKAGHYVGRLGEELARQAGHRRHRSPPGSSSMTASIRRSRSRPSKPGSAWAALPRSHVRSVSARSPSRQLGPLGHAEPS